MILNFPFQLSFDDYLIIWFMLETDICVRLNSIGLMPSILCYLSWTITGKLKYFGFKDDSVELTRSYFDSYRQNITRLGVVTSAPITKQCGVPQWSAYWGLSCSTCISVLPGCLPYSTMNTVDCLFLISLKLWWWPLLK